LFHVEHFRLPEYPMTCYRVSFCFEALLPQFKTLRNARLFSSATETAETFHDYTFFTIILIGLYSLNPLYSTLPALCVFYWSRIRSIYFKYIAKLSQSFSKRLTQASSATFLAVDAEFILRISKILLKA
jgi:hypothetical protein